MEALIEHADLSQDRDWHAELVHVGHAGAADLDLEGLRCLGHGKVVETIWHREADAQALTCQRRPSDIECIIKPKEGDLQMSMAGYSQEGQG